MIIYKVQGISLLLLLLGGKNVRGQKYNQLSIKCKVHTLGYIRF